MEIVKTISINPDLLKFGSKIKRKSTEQKEIKYKIPKENNQTLSKRNKLLKFIRRHQDNDHKSKTNEQEKGSNETTPLIPGNFDESLDYMMNMTDELKQRNTVHTLKNRDNEDDIGMVFPEPMMTPKYGCLKNGKLPTFRQFHNQTQRNFHRPSLGGEKAIVDVDTDEADDVDEVDVDEIVEIKNTIIPIKSRLINPVNKKILRRTFKVGKSNTKRQISVLVSNKTIRHDVTNKNQLLKQTPIIEVRRYLVKHGLIKIGSTSPPDVLRKMYESSSLMCGDVTNHNPETLMYNYINSDKKDW
jgi:hypothetical protein